MGTKFNTLKNSIYTASLFCLTATSCEVDIHHSPRPIPDETVSDIRETTCEIDLFYRTNINPNAIEPVVVCSVSGAPAYSEARCNMAFTAKNKYETLPIVYDSKTVETNFFGDVDISISNGNCVPGRETVKIFAECIINDLTFRKMDIPFANCGATH